MQVRYVHPFITSLRHAFSTLVGWEVSRGALFLRDEKTPRFPISGVIGLSGNGVGTVVLSLSEQVALKAASAMLMYEAQTIDADVIDAVGELTSMVAGGAKAELAEYALAASLPNVVTGDGHSVFFPTSVTPICVPFSTLWGDMVMEVGLTPVAAAVTT